MLRVTSLRSKFAIMVLACLLIIPVLAACGGDGNGDEVTPTSTSTATPTNAPTSEITNTSSPTPTASSAPVKIGVINPWSGPVAVAGTAYADPTIKFMDKQVNDAGGVLGGRPVKFVKFDNRGAVAESTAGATKLVLEDKVSILTLGGVSGAEFAATGDAAEELKVPYVSFSQYDGMEQNQFAVCSSPPMSTLTEDMVNLVVNILKSKTAAFMQMQDTTRIESANDRRKGIEAAGIETVYFETIPVGTGDFMPYLTKLKSKNPDVLVLGMDSEQCITMAKQIMELGGWGQTKVVSTSHATSAAKFPGAEGWIMVTPWAPGMDYPASLKFEQDWKSIIGTVPAGTHMYYYIAFLTAIKAIEFAGTDDPIQIAQGLRSGNLEFDTPLGMAHFNQTGESGLKYMYAQIQKGGTTVQLKS